MNPTRATVTLAIIGTLAVACIRLGDSSGPSEEPRVPPSVPGHETRNPVVERPRRQLSLFEPEGNRVLHFTGPTVDQAHAVDDYTNMVGPELAPVGTSIWIGIPGTRPGPQSMARLKERIEEVKAAGRMLNLSLSFENGRVDGFGTASDREVAETDLHDAAIDELALLLKELGVPTILRIGGEINGKWQGNTPYVFPLAYRKVVSRFRAIGTPNVAFAWCVEPRGDNHIDGKRNGRFKWFPGDDFIDWYGVDVFGRPEFSVIPGRRTSATISAPTRLLLAMAKRAGKPVIVGETTPFRMHIPPGSEDPRGDEARRIWREWFKPFTEWLDLNSQIKAVVMLSVDWSATRVYTSWGDARIQINPTLSEMWREELRRDRWIHKPALPDAIGLR